MKNKIVWLVFPAMLWGFIFLMMPVMPLYAETPLKVVTTTAYFADVVKKIGGERVDVKYVALPRFNVHYIQPKPSDVRNVSKADLFVHAGLDLELWAGPLLEAAGKPDLMVGGQHNLDLSKDITLLKIPYGDISRSQGDIHLFGNPHYTLDPENLRFIANAVRNRLMEMDPSGSAEYEIRAAEFLTKLDTKLIEWRALLEPSAGQEVISYHDDIAYLAHFAGIEAHEFIEPKPGIPPTPKHLQFLETYIRKKSVRAILTPTYFDKDAPNALARKTGVSVVDIYQNAGEVPGTEDVFGLFDANFYNLSEALK